MKMKHVAVIMATFVGICMAGGELAASQIALDAVLFRYGNEIVTQLDVRQARMLKLVEVTSDTDQAYVDAIVNRRLLLADARRMGAPEPTTEAVDARRKEWESQLGPGASVSDLLSRAAMSPPVLRAWLQDDLRVQAYCDDRFARSSDRAGDLQKWVQILRQRAGIR
jgi:hypothetical protein